MLWLTGKPAVAGITAISAVHPRAAWQLKALICSCVPQDASGASKDEIAAALSTVAAGRIPKDRIALSVSPPKGCGRGCS